MIQTVLKRDGRVVGFNEEKIATAIRKAMLHTDKGEDLQLIHQITDRISFKGDSQMTVEAIQDLVEVELMKSSRKDVAQKYIAYRNQRSIARKAKTRDMFLEIINIKSNDITRENANMNADTPAGMMMKFASETTKPFVDDYLLQPLDGLTDEERIVQHAVNKTVSRVHQSMEAFIHNMNTIHSRGGNQVVFSSINYGTDTSAEGRCIIRELLKSTYQGVGNGETAIFPIQIWKKKRGVSYLPEDRNYDLYQLACKVTARRFFPNFLNLDATFNQSEDWKADDPKRYQHEVATMGCRTRVFENRFGPKTSIGRGNISFSTINIVRLGIECMNIEDKEQRIARFFAKLDSMLEVTARQLHERMEFQKTAFAKQFPLLMSALWIGSEKLKPNDTIASVINQGTLGIGFIGLAECLVALLGKHHGESGEAQELGLKIVTYMRDRANQFSEQYQHNYSVLATPAEGLSGKFTRIDRKKFGTLPGITDRDYYTNSNHVPVYYKCSARHKAEVEAPYHELTRGGHIFYVEIDGDATHNPEVIMRVVDMMDQYNIGYGSVNHNRNRCLECGHENSTPNLEECPKCGSKHIDKLQRITGYLVGTTDRWNNAKLAELNDRVVHN